jgi:Ca-activated chloride channel family protein
MSESQHPESIWNDPRITAYALGELSPDEVAAFESEMAANPELAAAVAEANVLTSQLKSHFALETTPPLDAARRSEILAQSTVSPLQPVDGRPWWKRRWIELAVAASLVFIVIGLSSPMIESKRLSSYKTQSPSGVAIEGPADSPAKANSEELAVDSLRYQQSMPMAASSDANDPFGGAESPEPMLQRSQQSQPYELAETAIPKSSPQPSGVLAQKKLGSQDGQNGASAEVASVPGVARGIAMPARTEADSVTPFFDGEASMGGMGGMMGAGMAGAGMAGADMMGMGAMDGYMHARAEAIDEGRGPGMAGDRFDPITDNPFKRVSEHPLSTFSIDVDTASYSKVRSFLTESAALPRPDAVRIEEMINYFDYAYEPPAADSEHPLVARAEIVSCPWNRSHRLARIALKGKTFATNERPASNLVFLIDSSGSMSAPNKLPLVQEGMKLLLSKLGPNDRVAIVVYAGSAGLVLESTPASEDAKIRRALTQLAAGGSTNGGAGITLAYQTARDHFIKDGVNRVILCTDGDFNVGTTGTDSLVRMVEQEAKGGVFLTVLGFGMGNHNDSMLEQISGKGNGTYAFIDTINEARKVLVDQTDSTLVTIAKDVKLQLEFNPARVSAYRLIGYENRVLAKEDFNDDKKDAGEIGAGHTVTALYEIVPVGIQADAIAPPTDELKYQKGVSLTEAAGSEEVLTVKMRYKEPDGDTSKLVEFPLADAGKSFQQADVDVRFAAAVAGFGMKLRSSPYAGNWTYSDVEKTAEAALGEDPYGLRAEFLELVRTAATLTVEE